jgi:hypothetical protein
MTQEQSNTIEAAVLMAYKCGNDGSDGSDI